MRPQCEMNAVVLCYCSPVVLGRFPAKVNRLACSRRLCPQGVSKRRRVRMSLGLDEDSENTAPPQGSGSGTASATPALEKQTSEGNVSLGARQEMLEFYYNADESKFQRHLGSGLELALKNFRVELGELLLSLRRLVGLELPQKYLPPDCLALTLSNELVNEREKKREDEARRIAAENPAGASRDTLTVEDLALPTRLLYRAVCWYIDVAFDGRPIPRLWFLEIVARMPYYAYVSCLHLYSTLGWWRSPELMNIHYSEQLNEAFHCSVCESLGGDKKWSDRFTAFHSAVLYYWFLVLLFLVSPSESYAFSQALESHAVDTYEQLLEENEVTLKALPPPRVAFVYYEEYLYYFDEFQMDVDVRRPKLGSLYDVFQNILEDEREHSKTVAACVDYTKSKGKKKFKFKGRDLQSIVRDSREVMSKEQRKAFWKKWSALQADGVQKTPVPLDDDGAS